MTPEQIFPAVAKILQARYVDRWSVYRASIGLPLPKRRPRARKPIPGVLDTQDGEAG